MSNPTPTLEQKIAAALTTADVTSTDLGQLIAETEVGITTADQTADEERVKALDPALSPDPKAAREAMQDAEFSRDRLKTLLPRLETRYREIAEAEALAVWRAEADELEPRGVALLDGFAEFYPEMAKRIADHLDDMRAFDKQVDDLNRRRPNGVPALSRSTPALAKDLRIPSPYKTGELWWPPPQPNLALQYLAAMPQDPFLVHEAAKGTYIERVTAASLRITGGRSPRPSSASASENNARPPRWRKSRRPIIWAVPPAEKQEMQMPDDNPYYAPMRPEPSKERLNAPSSRVIVKNTSEVQNHIVIDRFNVGHELRPGEAREMEMLNDEIANLSGAAPP